MWCVLPMRRLKHTSCFLNPLHRTHTFNAVAATQFEQCVLDIVAAVTRMCCDHGACLRVVVALLFARLAFWQRPGCIIITAGFAPLVFNIANLNKLPVNFKQVWVVWWHMAMPELGDQILFANMRP